MDYLKTRAPFWKKEVTPAGERWVEARESDDEAAWPYAKPQYLILNLAIGGSWGGSKGVDDAIFPARYEIDYVRVYESVK